LNQTGWVASNSKEPFKPDDKLNAGVLKGQTYSSLVQFDVTSLAPGSKILFAALDLNGRSNSNLAATGQWNIEVLDTKISKWDEVTFDTAQKIPALFALSAPLQAKELAAGIRRRFVFTPRQQELAAKLIDVGFITIRLSGPQDGADNLFVWEGTAGPREPRLYLVAVPAPFTVITSVPTPSDLFAAATRVVGQTLQARRLGTPTPLPRGWVTATPLSYVVVPAVPTAANPTAAAATAIYVTAVAVTTGTWTPTPAYWITATPPPIAIPFASLPPASTGTPTLEPLWPATLAKRPLPGVLYNKIAFLSGDRAMPTAWIVDPDGGHLAQLTDRIYYDIAAARDTISPDGSWMLYNAPDKSNGEILQIWRLDLRAPSAPPEQITFQMRGIAFAPAWSPDGTKIVYTSTKDGARQEIFLFDFNDPRRWTRLSLSQDPYFWNQSPTWSPDGKQIAFVSDRGHLAAFTEIWVMSADGSNAHKIGDGKRDAWAPVWIKWQK
jgi:hypothetical protein